MKEIKRYVPTLPEESMQKIRKLLEKINEDMRREVYNTPKPTRPALQLIRGGKS